MASTATTKWKQFLQVWCPFLFWICPGANLHWFWDRRICYCRLNEITTDWHGGIWVDGKEYIPYQEDCKEYWNASPGLNRGHKTFLMPGVAQKTA